MAFIEIPLIFLVFPLLAALIAKTGAAGKIGWYAGTATLTLCADALAIDIAPPVGSLMATVLVGALLLLIAATTCARCPHCRKGVHKQATKCPYCQSTLAANA